MTFARGLILKNTADGSASVKDRWRLSARDNNQPVSLESLVKRFRMKMCDRVNEQQKPVVPCAALRIKIV